jgi:ParB-like nuclease domain
MFVDAAIWESAMYMDQLEVRQLPVGQIYLDPNNPRFWTEQNVREVPDRRIPDDKVQSDTRVRIDRHGIDDLYNSILRNGYLLLDRIVVRPIDGFQDKYVVVEGNRRFRSVSKLREDIENGTIAEEGIDEDYLQRLFGQTSSIEVLIYHGSDGLDISWMLQGIRHISGIRAWEPAQRAKLVAEQIDREGQSFRSAGQQFGLSPQSVGRLYRTYKALLQMREDDEFGPKARNDYFSLFEEAYRNSTIRDWLGWSEEARRFNNIENTKRFYSWIAPDDEHADKRRRIHDPKQIKELAFLIENENLTLISEFDSHDITISEAFGRATAGGPKPKDWRKSVESALSIVADLPQSAMFDETVDFIAELDRLATVIAQRRTAAQNVLNGQ